MLVHRGALPNLHDEYGDTPLLLAARKGHAQMVRLLRDKGGDLEARSIERDTVVHYAARSVTSQQFKSWVWWI
jgi:ankyrin repeat protein